MLIRGVGLERVGLVAMVEEVESWPGRKWLRILDMISEGEQCFVLSLADGIW